ncbi:hypothetical protein BA895_10930 [Humibacillus sp. DSM 29435]|nr:hypothetical protein BA895_10930 [Humibacillus sp. DSM 29435]
MTQERALNFADRGVHGCGQLLQDMWRRKTFDPTRFPSLDVRYRHVDAIRKLARCQPDEQAHAAKPGIIAVWGEQIAEFHAEGCRQPCQHQRAGGGGAEFPTGDPFTTRNTDQSGQLVLREPLPDTSCPQSLGINSRFLATHRPHPKAPVMRLAAGEPRISTLI